jgi:two-component system response regulator FixJ
MSTQPISVAIVDDDPSVRCGLLRFCDVAGLTANAYASGCELIAALDGTRATPDCLLIDAHMPEMNGLELHRHLVTRGVSLPTIVFTAEDSPELSAQFTCAGVVRYLQKPLPCRELLAAIENAVYNARQRQNKLSW